MNQQLIDYAIKHELSLGHTQGDRYWIRNPKTLQIVALSHRDSVHSAMIMMRKFVKVLESAPRYAYWR